MHLLPRLTTNIAPAVTGRPAVQRVAGCGVGAGGGSAGDVRTAADDRHAGKANAVFIDGHAEPMSLADLGYRHNPDGSIARGDDGPADPPSPDRPTNRWFSGAASDRDPPSAGR